MKYEHEIKELLRALTGLIKEATHFLRHLEAPKPKGHAVFRFGIPREKHTK